MLFMGTWIGEAVSCYQISVSLVTYTPCSYYLKLMYEHKKDIWEEGFEFDLGYQRAVVSGRGVVSPWINDACCDVN